MDITFSRMFFLFVYLSLLAFGNGISVEELHQETAPAIVFVSPKGNIKQSDYMDITVNGFSAEAIMRWITGITQIQIRLFRPPNYTGTMILALFMSLGAAVLYFRRINLDCLYNRSLWSAISLVSNRFLSVVKLVK
uniref:Tumor suppressor candidate 3 n=1 Tax=Schistosoma haematobium TaxID=6185 RepID=A0A094ZJ45_SCHHA